MATPADFTGPVNLGNPNEFRILELAEKIIALLSDPLRREQMGQSGENKTFARFTWDRIIDKMEHIYRDVVEGTKKPCP